MTLYSVKPVKKEGSKYTHNVTFRVSPEHQYINDKGFSASIDNEAIEAVRKLIKAPSKTFVLFQVRDYLNEYKYLGTGGMTLKNFIEWARPAKDGSDYHTIWSYWFKK